MYIFVVLNNPYACDYCLRSPFWRTPFFCYMLNNPKFSRFLLESANEAMDALVDGASEYYKSFIVLKRLHDDKGLPVDGQRMQEM